MEKTSVTVIDGKEPRQLSFASICLRRPIATVMLFAALLLLGAFSWFKIPIELVPALKGEKIYVSFHRPSAPPEVIENELLLPLERQLQQIAGVSGTWGEIKGAAGEVHVDFAHGYFRPSAQLAIQKIVSDIQRTQPEGTLIKVSNQDSSAMSRFVMSIQVTGGEKTYLRELLEQQVQARFLSVAGVSRAFVSGGNNREVRVSIDLERCKELGINPMTVRNILHRAFPGKRTLGRHHSQAMQFTVVTEGTLKSLTELRALPINAYVKLEQVADVRLTGAKNENGFRVNGQDALGILIFKQASTNLTELGVELNQLVKSLDQEYGKYGVSFIIGYDASEKIDGLMSRLQLLGLTGFAVALLVLYLFVRQFQAVLVVAISVPLSLMIAVSLLYLGGYSLNMITLFGLTIGVGMLVDNSIVVYEAVLRCLERGYSPRQAATTGVKRTLRAILTASVTNAVVFFPLIYFTEDALLRQVMELIAVAIVIPLFASLFVAATLVPLLTERVAARALVKLGAEDKSVAGRIDTVQVMFAAILKVFLRRPTAWLTGLLCVTLLSMIIALPWLFARGMNSHNEFSDEIITELVFSGGGSLSSASRVMSRFENAVQTMDGVARVESSFNAKEASFTVYMDKSRQTQLDKDNANVRKKIADLVSMIDSVQILQDTNGDGIEQRLANNQTYHVFVSGHDMASIHALATEVQSRLQMMPQLHQVTLSSQARGEELTLGINPSKHLNYQAFGHQLLDVLNYSGQEGQQLVSRLSLASGQQFPVVVDYKEQTSTLRDHLDRYAFVQEQGVIALSDLVTQTIETAIPSISHRNGRREAIVSYQLKSGMPTTGPEFAKLRDSVAKILADIHRPSGYIIEIDEEKSSVDKAKLYFLPIVLLLYLVLAISFESIVLPVLVLLALPLCIIGSVWALLLAGLSIDIMVVVGIVVLLGLAVNPAVLLVDRMQQLIVKADTSVAKAAMIAVRERSRPVIMTACTTFCGLWPMAFQKGIENEIWPSFATAVMGGILSSALLTLFVIPVGFFLTARLTNKAHGLSNKVWCALLLTTVLLTLAVTQVAGLAQWHWQLICALFIGFGLYLLLNLFGRRSSCDRPQAEQLASIEARFLTKTYGAPGVIGKAWQRCKREQGKLPENKGSARRQAFTYLCLAAGAWLIATNVQNKTWYVLVVFLLAAMLARSLYYSLFAFRPLSLSEKERLTTLQHRVAKMVPWLAVVGLFGKDWLVPVLNHQSPYLPSTAFVLISTMLAVCQFGRVLATNIVRGKVAREVEAGRFAWLINLTRQLAVTVFGIGLSQRKFTALRQINFKAHKGMIGLLGPNGAGKSTLLRLLAGVYEPSVGTLWYAGVSKKHFGAKLSQLIGYLPQDFGLYSHLTAREYLDYFALMYEIDDGQERVTRLLKDVGLLGQQNEKISSFSGGMRQRVGIARALLRLPPILIVDEPTVGLDPYERIKLRNLLVSLAKQRVVLFSTHVIEDVEVSCDRVVILKSGQLVFDGEPQALANLAEDNVWQLRVSPTEASQIAQQVKVVNQINDGDGEVYMRVLSKTRPHASASLDAPNLEDGYLQFFVTEQEQQYV